MPEQKIKVKMYTCGDCGHTWIPRIEDVPKVCPRCKSYKWNGRK